MTFRKNVEAGAHVREIEAAGGEAFAVQGDVGSVAGVRPDSSSPSMPN